MGCSAVKGLSSNASSNYSEVSQSAITCSKLIIETLEQGVKYTQC